MRRNVRTGQPRRLRKLLDPCPWQYVKTYLAESCSSGQIAKRLRRAYPDDVQKPLSAETIYVGPPHDILRAGLNQAVASAQPRRSRAPGTGLRGQVSHMNVIAHRLNTRSRKCLDFATPWKSLRNCVIIHPVHLECEIDREVS